MSTIRYIVKECPFCKEAMLQEDMEESKYYIIYECTKCGFVAHFDKYRIDRDTIRGYIDLNEGNEDYYKNED